MAEPFVITLGFFALVSFTGGGMSLAVVRARSLRQAEPDSATYSLATLLLVCGICSAYMVTGVAGVFALGGVATWYSYVVTAQKLGVFRIEHGQPRTQRPAEHRRIA